MDTHSRVTSQTSYKENFDVSKQLKIFTVQRTACEIGENVHHSKKAKRILQESRSKTLFLKQVVIHVYMFYYSNYKISSTLQTGNENKTKYKIMMRSLYCSNRRLVAPFLFVNVLLHASRFLGNDSYFDIADVVLLLLHGFILGWFIKVFHKI